MYAQLVESWTRYQSLVAFSGEVISKMRQETRAEIATLRRAECDLVENVDALAAEVARLETKTSALSAELACTRVRELRLVDENNELTAELSRVRPLDDMAEAVRRLEEEKQALADELAESKANLARLEDGNAALERETCTLRMTAVRNLGKLKEEADGLRSEKVSLLNEKRALALEKDSLIRTIYSMRLEAARNSTTRAEIEEEVLSSVFRHNHWDDGMPICPVTMERIRVPAVVGVCGHMFESEAINRWWQQNPKCPACNGETSIRFDLAKPRDGPP